MARVKDNLLTSGTAGTVGKNIVYKQINGKTFMSKYPDMSQVQYNKTQIEYQNLFAHGVEYAQGVLKDPDRVAAYRKKMQNDKRHRHKSIYHFALQLFMKKYSRKMSSRDVKKTLQPYHDNYKFSDRQAAGVEYLVRYKKLTNSLYQQLNKVSRATATRDLQDLVRQGVIITESKGAGAIYSLLPIPTLHKPEDEDDEPDEEEELI